MIICDTGRCCRAWSWRLGHRTSGSSCQCNQKQQQQQGWWKQSRVDLKDVTFELSLLCSKQSYNVLLIQVKMKPLEYLTSGIFIRLYKATKHFVLKVLQQQYLSVARLKKNILNEKH